MFSCEIWEILKNTYFEEHLNDRFCVLITSSYIDFGQVDSPELPETPEITEMTEDFTKVTKYLTKFKETLTNYVWEKSHVKKQ